MQKKSPQIKNIYINSHKRMPNYPKLWSEIQNF